MTALGTCQSVTKTKTIKKTYIFNRFWVKRNRAINTEMCYTHTHTCIYIYIYIYIGKSKAVPLQAWSGPKGSRKLRFPDFMTTAQGGGKIVSLTHGPHLPPGNPPDTHFC